MVPVDMPSWSLGIEVRAMLFMPIIVWAARGHWTRTLLVMAAWLVECGFTPNFTFGVAFIMGARLSSFDFRCALLEQEPFQWLGNISYSLYMCQWPVVAWLYNRWGVGGSLITMPVVLGVAWSLWALVERPSIMLSKKFHVSSAPVFSLE